MSNWRSLTNGSATKNTGWRSLVPDYKPNSVSNTYSNDEESDERNDDYTKYLKQLLAEQEKQRQLMSQQNAMNETQDSGVMSAQSAMRNGQTWQQKYQSYSDAIDKALAVPNAAYNAGKTANRNTRNTESAMSKYAKEYESDLSSGKAQQYIDKASSSDNGLPVKKYGTTEELPYSDQGGSEYTYRMLTGQEDLAKAKTYNTHFLNGDERNQYLYIVGKHGLAEGNRYLDSKSEDINKRYADYEDSRMTDTVENNGALGVGIGLAMNAAASMGSGILGYAAEANTLKSDNKLDQSDPLFRGTRLQNTTQNSLGKVQKETLQKATGKDFTSENSTLGKASDFLVGTGLSSMNSLLSAFTLPEPAVLGSFSGNAMSQSLYDSSADDNKSKGQAELNAVANGVAESFFEKFSVENLNAMREMPVSSVKDIMKNFAKSFVTEGSEETFTDIANDLSDVVINGKNSELGKLYENGVSEGNDPLTSFGKALLSRGGSALMSGLAGGLSGLGSAVAGTTSSVVSNGYDGKEAHQSISNIYGNEANNADTSTEYGQSKQQAAQRYADNPYLYDVDAVDTSTKEGEQYKANAQAIADKYASNGKVSRADESFVRNAVEGSAWIAEEKNPKSVNVNNYDHSNYLNDLESVPDEYRTPISNVSMQETRTAMENAAQNDDAAALADAYQRGKMSTSSDTRNNVEDDYDIAKGMLLNRGSVTTEELSKAMESRQDAYLSGLNGDEKSIRNMSESAAAAYTAGYNQHVENAANSKVGNGVDLHHVAVESDTGRVASVAGFASVKMNNGQRNISLKTTDGSTVDYSDINISNGGVARLYEYAAKQGTVDDMNAYIDNYVKNMPIGQYNNAFNRYYSQGASGTKSFNDLYSSDKYGYKSFLSKNQLQTIYNIGANETTSQLLENAKDEGKSIAVRGTGIVTDLRHSKADDSYIPLVSSVAKTLGLDVVLSDSMEDGVNGQFERAMQRVTLNTKNKDAMFNTIFHEAFGEYMQAHNAAGASRVRSAILSYISDTKGSDYVSSIGKAYQRTYNDVEGTKTFNDALGEAVNDSIAGIFSTEEGIHDLRTWMDNKYDEKKSRGVLSDVADYFKGVAASLRSLIKDGHLSTASMNTAEMAEKRASDIRKMVLEEMDTAAKNAAGTTVDASTKGKANYSVVVDTDGNSLSPAQQKYFNGTKVVDENGALKVMYHGSQRAGFTVFDPRRSDDNTSLFFTDDPEVAESYSGTDETNADKGPSNYEVYLNVKNPRTIDAKGSSWRTIITDNSNLGSFTVTYDGGDQFTVKGVDDDGAVIYDGAMDEAELYDYFGDFAEGFEEPDMGVPVTLKVPMSYANNGTVNKDAYLNTRSLSLLSKINGNDGVIIKHLRDTGEYGGTNSASTVVIVFNSNQIKSISNKNPSMHDDIRYSLDLGYHAGDLGKAESLGNQSGGRSTGHFGTGTYFVSDTSKLVGDYNTRPVEEVDFSNYNLYRPASERDGFKLHNFLKGVNSFWNMDDNAIKSEDEWYRLHDRFIDSLYDDGAQENSKEIFDLANRLYGSDVSVNRKIENAGSDVGKLKMLDTYRYADDVPGYLSAYGSWNDTIDTAANDLFGITGEEAREIVSDIKSEIDSKNYSLDGKYKADSASTRFMKALGFEGVDVRGYDGFDTQSQGLDNTAYGSVIYDLKGADKQRKDDIGTARYSLEIDDAWDNAWDDAWDDVVNDYDNKQESLVDDMQISLDSASSILAEGAEALKNTEVNKSTVRKVASEIIHNTGSSYGTMALTNNLEKVFAYMQSADNVDYKDLMRVLEEVAQPVIDTSNTTVGKESYQEFMQALKGYKVSLTSKQLAEVKRAYGSLSTFKRLVPSMTFSQNENLSLDSVWDEISEMTGGILDYDTNEGDMPFALADAVEAMKPQVKNNFGGNNRQVAYDTALDIVEKYFDSAATDAANAEAKKQINAAKMKMAETNRNYKAKVREQYSAKVKEERQKALAAGKQKADTVVASLKEKQKETLAKLREEKNDDKAQALREQADHYQERISNIIKQKNAATLDKVASVRAANDKRNQKAAEHRKAMHEKNMIDRYATKLFNWLANPSDMNHVPKTLQNAVENYLGGIDFMSPQITPFTDPKSKTTKYQVTVYDGKRFVKKIASSQAEAYELYQNAIEAGLGTNNDRKWRERMGTLSTLLNEGEMSSDDTDMNDFLQGVDPSLAQDFKQIIANNEGVVRLSDLGAEDLHTINMLTRNVMSAINHINKAFTSNDRISDLAESTINSEIKGRKDHSKATNSIMDLLQVKNATPETYFHFLSDGGQKIYKMLRRGLNARTRDVKESSEYMGNVLKGIKGVNKWSGDHAEMHEFDTIEGRKIKLTTAQIMTLYEMTKREQAMIHLPGGFSVEEMTIGGKQVKQQGLHLSDAQIGNIVGALTEEQKTVADKMQQFMATECSEWGNRASRKMYDYDKFNDPDYFPIRTEEATHQTQNNNVSNDLINSIKNQGFTKQVVPNANNPLVLSDIFDVFTRHVTGMAAYDAYAPAISDALRWYNYRTVETGSDGYKSYGNTVKDAISRVYGNEGRSYFVKLIQNINDKEKGGSEFKLTDKMISRYKAAAVAANWGVVVQQPTAYFRANNVLSPKYLTQAMLEMKAYRSDAKAAYKMQDESSDISWWKSQGYWETSIGRSMKAMITGNESTFDKAKNALMAPAGWADDITWRKLYLATYLEQKEAFSKAGKNIDGADFQDAVNDRFDEIIDRTQVVDSTLHRSQLMRSNDTKDKLFTSFMSEPTKSYNMLMRATYDCYSDKDKVHGAKTLARAAVTFMVANLVNDAVKSFAYAIRNDDDKDYWEKYLETLVENMQDDLNPLMLIPFVRDIASLVSPYAQKWIGELTGNTDEEAPYTTSSADMSIEAVTNLLDAADADLKYWATGTSTSTPYGIIKKNARALSQVTGFPVYNLMRDGVAVYNTLSDVGNWKKLYSKQSDVKAHYKQGFTDAIESGTGIEHAVDDYVANGQKLESAENAITRAYKEEYLSLYAEDPAKADALAEKLNKAYAEVDKLSGEQHDASKDTSRYAGWIKDSDVGQKEKADVFTSIDNGGDYKKEIKDALDIGYSYDSIRDSLSAQYKQQFIELYNTDKPKAGVMKSRLAEVYTYIAEKDGTYKDKNHAQKIKIYTNNIEKWLK